MNIFLLVTTLVALAIAAPKPDCNCNHSGTLEFNSGSSLSNEYSNKPSVSFVPYSQQQPANSYNYQSENSASPNLGTSYGRASSGVNQGSPNYSFGSGGSALGNGATYGQSSSSVGSFKSDSRANQGNNNYNYGSGVSTLGNGASDGQSYSSVSSSLASDFGANQGNSNYNFGSANSDSVVTNAEASASAAASASVTKQLYFFEAPHDDDEVVKARYDLPSLPPKKTYKIIFIKAPAYKTQATINLPAPPQNDEKTLVYVLVKKPETDAKLQTKNAAPSQPTKPEVFFIKYKTQNEAQDAIAQIQGKYGATGQVIANLPAGSQAVVKSSDGHIVQKPQFVHINSVNGVVDGDHAASHISEAISNSNVAPQSSPNYVPIEQSSSQGENTSGGGISQSPTYVSLGQSSDGGEARTYSGSSGSAGVSYQLGNVGGQQEGSSVIVSSAEGASTTDSNNCDH
ncbi:unnamed protein product [Ceutorhynchus assimilis]|uniref:DUF243 domain-containing protein n=1 Tax=Ceutorhynchus assimilis TaxID=467358 RepID=A0A9N9QI56_9CUCU|nr:unnamed protein product [Ceutorhynchus assimilis]